MQKEQSAVRRYRLLLLAFPADFRSVYGEDVVRTFRDQWRARARSRSPLRRAMFWSRIGFDALVHGVGERLGRLTGRSPTPTPRRPWREIHAASLSALLERLATELRLALRALARRPGFTATAVAILGLPLAAAATLCGTVYHVSLAPLGFQDEDRLVQVWHKAFRGEMDERFGMSDALLLALRDRSRSLEEVAWIDIVAPQNGAVFEPPAAPPERVPYTRVSTNFFALLGVRPHLGRLFADGDEGEPRAVLSHGAWQRHFGGDPELLGRTTRLRGEAVEIVGVLPEDFLWPGLGPGQADFWLPVRLDPGRLDIFYFDAIGRARPDATIDEIELDTHQVLQPVSRSSFDEDYWGEGPERWVTVTSLREGQLGDLGPRVRALVAGVSALVLLGVVNLSLLVLIRSVHRTRETAVRVALGAGRPGVFGPALAEVALLTALAGAVALALSTGAFSLIRGLAPGDVARLDRVAMSPPVLLAGIVFALATGLAVATAPLVALRALSVRAVLQSMAEAAGGGAIPRGMRIPLLIATGALAVLLLFGASLTARSLVALETVDLGFRAETVLQGRIRLPVDRFWTRVEDAPGFYRIAPEMSTVHRELRERLESHPAVTGAALAQHTPLGPRYGGFTPFVREGSESDEMPPGEPWIAHNGGDPDFLRFMGVDLMTGRWLSWEDDEEAPRVAIVSDPLARRFWPGEDPIGQRFRGGGEWVRDATGEFQYEDGWITVVGVVTPMREWDVRTENETVYTPLAQERPVGAYVRGRAGPLSLFVRHRGDPTEVADHMRRTVAELLPGTPVEGIEPMTQLTDRMLAEPRFLAAVFSGFAGLALLLAAAGIAAVVGFGVSSRAREIGVRIALGAWTREVVPLFVGETLSCTLAGLALGVVLSVAAARAFESVLYQVPPVDPYSLLGAAVLFAAFAVVAAMLPVRRALRVGPARALRHE